MQHDKTISFSLTAGFGTVVICTFLLFLPDLRNNLLDWDDGGYIIENVRIRTLSLETVRWAFSEFYCNYWAPLTWLSLALDYAVWGLNPVGYHLTNNIIHSLNGGLFFLLTHRLLINHCAACRTKVVAPPTPGQTTNLLSCALIAALFFSLHPLRVESVAWATERKDVLALFFGLLAALSYLRHVRESEGLERVQQAGWYWLMLLLYALSLLSKAMLIMLPVVLLVLDWFPLARFKAHGAKMLLLEKVPMLMLAGLSSAVTMQAMSVSSKSLGEINLLSRIVIAFKSVATYLILTFWPVNLSPVYFHPGNITSLTLEHVLSIVLVIAVTAYCVWARRTRPVLLAAWLIYLATLFPILGLTQNGPQELAGRFTYLPSMALSVVVALGVMSLYGRLAGSKPVKASFLLAAVAVIGINAYFTVREISFWKNDVTLWTRVIDLNPHAFGKSYASRAYAYGLQGDYAKALADVNEALEIAARKRYRAMHEIYQLRALILKNLGDVEGAIVDYTAAIETAGERDRVRLYRERGSLYQGQGKLDLANADFRMAALGP